MSYSIPLSDSGRLASLLFALIQRESNRDSLSYSVVLNIYSIQCILCI